MQKVRLVKNQNINRDKWDRTIEQAQNSRLYAYSWYLDIVAPEWSGIIMDDYTYVMPIAQSKKHGLTYTYQPTYAQQHGVFPNPPDKLTDLFAEYAAKLSAYSLIAFNSENKLTNKRFSYIKKPNYLLCLNQAYDDLKSNYSKSHKRYVNNARKNVTLKNHIETEAYLYLKKESTENLINENNIKKLRLIIEACKKRNICEIIGAYDEKELLCAAGVFIKTNERLLYLNGVSNNAGKTNRAMYAIMDQIIKINAGKNLMLDFEGSSIEGIATFFARFGATPEYYTIAKRIANPLLKLFLK